jgi:outer membrane protein TolC
VITLEDALRIALSENVSVKVADKEIERAEYARKGTYASLFPQVDAVGSFQRTIKKQVMYMDFDMSSFGGMDGMGGDTSEDPASGGDAAPSIPDSGSETPSSGGGIEVGRWNTYSGGISAAMPLINAQLWKGIQISGQEVELAVEKARSSRLETVTQVKKAFFTVLLAKEAAAVYKSVYDNAVENLKLTEQKYNAQRASELDLTRAKTAVANAVPNVYDSENCVDLGLWQLKAVMGVALDSDIDVAGSLADYADAMLTDPRPDEDLSGNSTLRQLDIQARQLASSIKLQQYASLPSLALAFSYSLNAMTNDFKFSEYKWSPYSYIGLSLNIPIFAGGKRYHAVKAAKVQAAELDIQRANTERQLQIAVRQYLGTMETAIKSHASASSAVETATKAYGIARKSYDVGRSTLTDLNDAQLALTQSQLGVCQAIYNYLSAKSDLEGTLGADFLDKTANNE